MWQHTGYAMGHYSNGSEVYTGLGLDDFNSSYIPLYVGKAPRHHVTIGHPIIAIGKDAVDLAIQVTRVNQSVPIWHVSVNNLCKDREISVQLRVSMPELIGLQLPPSVTGLTLSPGEFRNLL